ncbi:MAG: HAD family hydrolase [Nitrososphaeria archaeon]
MNYELLRDYVIALKSRASVYYETNSGSLIVDRRIDGCGCRQDVISLKMNGFDVLIDLDDTIFHNDFADEIFPEYLFESSTDPFEAKTSILSAHYRYLSEFSWLSFDWEKLYLEHVRPKFYFELDRLEEKYYRWPFVYRFRNALKLLKTLKRLGCRIYAYTNGYYKYQSKLLEIMGMRHYFDDIYSPDRLGVSKMHMFEKLNVHKDKTIVIGDDFFFDVEVPSYYGFKTILIYRFRKGPHGSPSSLPTYSFYDLRSLIKHIEVL